MLFEKVYFEKFDLTSVFETEGEGTVSFEYFERKLCMSESCLNLHPDQVIDLVEHCPRVKQHSSQIIKYVPEHHMKKGRSKTLSTNGDQKM